MIHSNANLGIHGQGVLNLSGNGDTIEAQRLILSLFYNILVNQVILVCLLIGRKFSLLCFMALLGELSGLELSCIQRFGTAIDVILI